MSGAGQKEQSQGRGGRATTTTSLPKGKNPVKGKIKNQTVKKGSKKAPRPLRRKAFLVAEMERFEFYQRVKML